ncbi:MAG: DUF397 domain-containing protein [Sciscionella sp.]
MNQNKGWRKSSYSAGENGCVEIGVSAGLGVGIRDSKFPEGGHFVVNDKEWHGFVATVKCGQLDQLA